MPATGPARSLSGMTSIQTRPVPATQFTCDRVSAAAAIAGATVSALIDWTVLHLTHGPNLAVRSGSSVLHIGAVSVIAAVVVAGLAGWGLLAQLTRHSKSPRRTWTI